MLVKICGIKTEDALVAADTNGADLVGFIFVADSRRYIEPEKAARLSAKLRHAKSVGVFVDAEIEEVERTAAQCSLSYVQLHGTEPADYARRIKTPVIKAWRWGDNFSLAEAEAYPAALHIIDSYRPGAAGGTGEVFRWREAVEELAAFQKPFLVAGGITEQNVIDALDTFHPTGVDISGGLEIDREKSAEKIVSFLRRVKQWRDTHHA